jgi:hypothetical protein
LNIEVKVDKVTLATVVAEVVEFDEDGDAVSTGREHTVAHLVAEQIVKKVVQDARYPGLVDQVTRIRDEEIRAAVKPAIEQAIARPIKRTNPWGERNGEETTLTEVIVEEARNLLKEPADRYRRENGTVLQQAVRAAVREAFDKEIADAVKEARDLVAGQLGSTVATQIQDAVTAGLKAR